MQNGIMHAFCLREGNKTANLLGDSVSPQTEGFVYLYIFIRRNTDEEKDPGAQIGDAIS
jgi:hypothetical protein